MRCLGRAWHCLAQVYGHGINHIVTQTTEPRSHREASLIDFGITPSEALKRFQAWQSQHWLAPSSLLKDPTTFTLQPTLLPFWLFEAAVEMRYSGDVRSIEGGNRADESQAAWQRTAWQAAPPHTYTWDQSHMQVGCAGCAIHTHSTQDTGMICIYSYTGVCIIHVSP